MLFPEARRGYKGLGDLLIYGALVADGIALNKDGSLLAGWHYHGPDLTSATAEELAALASQVNRAFLGLGDGWLLHADALRTAAEGYPDAGAFPDRVSRLIDEERRLQFQTAGRNFNTTYVLLLTYLPPREAETRFLRYLVERPGRPGCPSFRRAFGILSISPRRGRRQPPHGA
ncbi:MAG TPA: hypothetical protein VE078_08690 [Thermoanaerobaculia bacterium]|nr:hypothetical protein [Thermoanaerobaculia bacterium]